MELIDIGANLAHDSFDADRASVIERAIDAGVTQVVVTGSSEESCTRALELAAEDARLVATAGIHPHHAKDMGPDTSSLLRELAAHPEVRAIGETGLDFFRDFSPRPLQERAFEEHLALAIELQLPMFLHERDAYPRFAEILASYRSDLGDVVVHCFTGQQDALFAYLDLDCHIGMTGWVADERRGQHLLELIPSIPDDRLMIETDAPYLLPRNLVEKPRTRRNEPCYLPFVLKAVASCRGASEAEVAATTTRNARSFFDMGPARGHMGTLE